MGFLKIFGRLFSFEESKEYFEMMREGAVESIIDWIVTIKAIKCCPKFGYEVELHQIKIDEDKKRVLIDLSAEDGIIEINELEEKEGSSSDFSLHFEYGRWMVEVVPKFPFNLNEMGLVEGNMKNLYLYMNKYLAEKSNFLSISSFPKLGDKTEGNFYVLEKTKSTNVTDANQNITINSLSEEYFQKMDVSGNPYSQSVYIDDVIINTHPRFGTLTKNIRTRRGSKVDIKIPMLIDEKTNTEEGPYPGYIHMDAMAFGMGSTSLQVTVGTCSLNSTCFVYDQFIPICPILLALSSSSPIFKGKLSAYDNRFDIISQSVDDRTEDERNPQSPNYVCKSRYSPAYSYISENVYTQDFHNDDCKFNINESYLKRMIEAGVPKRLAQHLCNLFARDPLLIFENKIKNFDPKDRSHFENFNSTNWNSVRFKPPKEEDQDECFKVEIRPCELQLTPFENSAIIGFVMSLFLSFNQFDVNFIMPISLVNENFKRAYQKDSITSQKFYWRINGIDSKFNYIRESLCKNEFLKPHDNIPSYIFDAELDKNSIKELTIAEIVLGSPQHNYPGLLKLCDAAADFFCNKDETSYGAFCRYFDFIEKRAKGELWTNAKYIRYFVMNHPLYQKDSVVSDAIQYDLVKHLIRIQNGEEKPEKLYGIQI